MNTPVTITLSYQDAAWILQCCSKVRARLRRECEKLAEAEAPRGVVASLIVASSRVNAIERMLEDGIEKGGANVREMRELYELALEERQGGAK